MTERGVSVDLGRRIAELTGRVRLLEVLLGGGTQKPKDEALVNGYDFITSSTLTQYGLGPEVTVRIGRVGRCIVIFSASVSITALSTSVGGGNVNVDIGIELSGDNTVAIVPGEMINAQVIHNHLDTVDSSITVAAQHERVLFLDGLNPGLTTFTMKAAASKSSPPAQADPSFGLRSLQVIPA